MRRRYGVRRRSAQSGSAEGPATRRSGQTSARWSRLHLGPGVPAAAELRVERVVVDREADRGQRVDELDLAAASCTTRSARGSARSARRPSPSHRSSTTIAFTDCVHVGSGTPITAHSATSGGAQRALDLGRVDVLGRRLDHPRLRPDERERAVGFAPAEVVGVVPAAAEAGARSPRAGSSSRSSTIGPAATISPISPAGDLVVVGVDDAHLDAAATVRPCADRPRRAERGEREHADHLGLAVAAGVAAPRAGVDA